MTPVLTLQTSFYRSSLVALMALALAAWTGCGKEKDKQETKTTQEVKPQQPPPPKGPDAQALLVRAKQIFNGPLPAVAESQSNPITDAKVNLGRMLYYDARMSKNHDISCNSCHSLADYGIDVREATGERQVSKGHKGQVGERNSPTVYNAALQFRQFWDGRAADVEEQAKGPVLNPVEMSMPDETYVLRVIKSIPGYAELFKIAFPGEKDPITYDNIAKAIGAFERGLMTPAPFDEFLAGKTDILSEQELRGLKAFMETGCITCHMGPLLGGTLYQKLGLIKPYESKDLGRFKETQNPADMHMFKVPHLRNIEKTGPYLHDGSISTLEESVAMMAEYQTQMGRLQQEQIADMVAFLKTLTGDLPMDYIAQPELPASGPKTPKPDPN
jgi:cytochrome c peroxidase